MARCLRTTNQPTRTSTIYHQTISLPTFLVAVSSFVLVLAPTLLTCCSLRVAAVSFALTPLSLLTFPFSMCRIYTDAIPCQHACFQNTEYRVNAQSDCEWLPIYFFMISFALAMAWNRHLACRERNWWLALNNRHGRRQPGRNKLLPQHHSSTQPPQRLTHAAKGHCYSPRTTGRALKALGEHIKSGYCSKIK